MKKLTIGSAVYDDFDGVYFSYQSLRLNNFDILDDLDFLVIDNNPHSAQGQATRHFCSQSQGIRYIPYIEKVGTSIRNEIFKNAKGRFCMTIDAHVLFESATIKKLLNFLDLHSDSVDLYQGPMFFDDCDPAHCASKMDPLWRSQMYGVWAHDERANDYDGPPFEIDMHGLGVFVSKTDSWLGFNENFKGFGGEEGYIHKKYQLNNRKVWCLPFLRWLHRFDRPNGIPYTPYLHDKIKNYLISYEELGLSKDEMITHFTQEIELTIPFDELINEVKSLNIQPFCVTHSYERKTTTIQNTQTRKRSGGTLCRN